MSGYFKVKSKKVLSSLEVGERIEESDYATLTEDGVFVQLEYIEPTEVPGYKVSPGVYSIRQTLGGLDLAPTSFVKDKILDNFIYTQEITTKIDQFFNKLHVYYNFGFEVPKRGMLLYGPPGSGKTTVINKACEQYSLDKETLIVTWDTNKHDTYDVKELIKSFDYGSIKRMILVVEDIGGIELDSARRPSDSSLLSLLDNQEKTFKIPILILATTNFPEMFMGNLTNRPNRFDDKIKVDFPPAEARGELLKFFTKNTASQEMIDLIISKSCEEFSPAHIREAVIRSAIYDKTLESTIKEIKEEIEIYKKAFKKITKVGI